MRFTAVDTVDTITQPPTPDPLVLGGEQEVPPLPRPGPWRRLAETWSPRRVKVSLSLRFYAEVLGLEHLHYGLWDGEPLSLEGLKTAQQRYAETLAEWIPRGTRSVLDVGCGLGTFARMLAQRGFAIEGLSPDPYQQQAFSQRVQAPFHLVRFQEFVPQHPFDLIVMSESVQYIWLDRLFPAVRRVAPQGHLLLADYFRLPVQGELPRGSGHDLRAFLAEAQRQGLVLEQQEDITDRVTPTLDLARQWLESYLDPTLRLLNETFAARYPRLFALGHRLLRRRLAKVRAGREMLEREHFQRTRRYLIMRFRV